MYAMLLGSINNDIIVYLRYYMAPTYRVNYKFKHNTKLENKNYCYSAKNSAYVNELCTLSSLIRVSNNIYTWTLLKID